MSHKKFKHLTESDRAVIQNMLTLQNSVNDIAQYLGFSRSAIYREIRTNSEHFTVNSHKYLRPYNALYAQRVANVAKEKIGHGTKLTPAIEKSINDMLKKGYTPEMMVHINPRLNVSVSTIYYWINHIKLKNVRPETHLMRHGKRFKHSIRRQFKKRQSDKQTTLDYKNINRRWVPIDQRPKYINNRTKPFHWEMDGVESSKSKHLIITFVERKTRFAVAIKSPDKSAASVSNVIREFLKEYGHQVRSITHDHGQEFMNSSVGIVLEKYSVDEYVAHAYSSWERGSNENFNGRLRRIFPKGTDFSKVAPDDLQYALDKLNAKPMKVLQYKSPEQAFTKSVHYQQARNARRTH
jgi:Transposase and inactivated derivatives, IS30 family